MGTGRTVGSDPPVGPDRPVGADPVVAADRVVATGCAVRIGRSADRVGVPPRGALPSAPPGEDDAAGRPTGVLAASRVGEAADRSGASGPSRTGPERGGRDVAGPFEGRSGGLGCAGDDPVEGPAAPPPPPPEPPCPPCRLPPPGRPPPGLWPGL
ncbi:hypothetical protein FAGKG844_210062 [Frankia sp. AgKG'84/4]